MENQQSKLDKAVKISIMAGALIVAVSISYYLVVFLPQKEQSILERQKQEHALENMEKKELEEDLNNCLKKAKEDGKALWDSYCKITNSKKMDPNNVACLLNSTYSEKVKKSVKENEDNCFKKFPQN